MSFLQLAWLDIKRLARNRFLRIALLGLCLMPLLYSFLYLDAFWDPYGKLPDLPVALVNEDRGGTLDGKAENFGADLTQKLVEHADAKWSVVSASEAKEGLDGHRFYLSLTIPTDFTAKVLTATEEHPQKAELIYVANEGKNFLASSIGKRLMSEIRAQVSEEISGKFFAGVLVEMQDGAKGLHDAADGAGKLADGQDKALQGVNSLQDGTAQLADGAGKLAEGLAQAQDGAGRLAGGLTLASDQLGKAGKGASQLAEGLAQAGKGSGQLVGGLAQLQAGGKQVAGGLDQLSAGLGQFKAGLNDSQKGVPALTAGMAQVQAGTQAYGQQAGQALAQLQTGATQTAAALGQAQALLQKLAATDPAVVKTPEYQQALALVGAAQGGLSQKLVPGMQQLADQSKAGIAQLAQGQAQIAAGIGQLQTTSNQVIDQLSAGTGALKTGVGALAQGAQKLSAGATALDQGLTKLGAGADQLQKGLNDPSGMAQLQAGAQSLQGGLGQLHTGAVQLHAGLTTAQDGEKQLADGLTQLADGSKTLSSKLTDAAQQMADKSKGDTDARGKLLGSPVDLNEQTIHPVPFYGMGFAPYFIPLSLWVGAMMLFFVVSIKENRLKASLTPAPVLVLTKYMTLGFFVTLQALITSWVILHFLGLQPQSLLGFYLFNVLMSWTFVAIMYLLVVLMGVVGRFLGIVVLMLQLTSCAGTFPLEMLPKFFQVINPFMPMTYGTAGLRYLIAGSSTIDFSTSLWVLGGYLVGALLLVMVAESRFVTLRDLHPSQELAS